MNGAYRKCARAVPDDDGNYCSEYFWTGKVHNKIYCCTECCRLQTNANIAEQYQNNKRRLAGEVRICADCNTAVLSRYNETTVCSMCSKKDKESDHRFRFLVELEAIRGVQ